LLQFYIYYLLL